MKVFFTATIDTEIDKSPDWKVSEKETFFSVLDGIPNKLSPVFDKFGAKPTYLLSSEVMENDECISILGDIKNCELGTHLHADLVEPERSLYKIRNMRTSAIQCSYSKEIEYKKLENLTTLFIKKFGYRPISFRAGRFGAGNNTIGILEKLGYLVDSSVTPHIDWNLPEGRANFLSAPEQPYFPDKNNLSEKGKSKILEVPVSIINPFLAEKFNYCKKMPVLGRFFRPVWLRPSFQSADQMIFVMKNIIKNYSKKENIVLNMMFHSMEVAPGASPYNKTEKDCLEFLNDIDHVLGYCKENKFNFVTLSGIYPYFSKE